MTERSAGSRPGWGDRWRALGWSALLTGRILGVTATSVATLVSLTLVVVGIGVWMFPACVRALHAQARGIATTHERCSGVTLDVPALPASNSDGFIAHARHTWALLTDGATWRMLRWALIDSCTGIGIVLAIMPLGLVGWGIEGLVVLPVLWLLFGITPTEWYAFIPVFEPGAIPGAMLLAIGFIALGYATGPWWLRVHGRWAAWLLGGERAALRARVDELSISRTESREDAAAELRRIEQEIHDGTQSQLVAIGLTLGTAEAIMSADPDRARALVAKARDDSSAALAELRDLIRGVRPPILSDRGLGPALESLALDSSTTVETTIALPERLDPSLEAAVYFAVREFVGNAIKHADASRVRIDARIESDRLTVIVLDDGRGGAVLVPGHGLDAARRRLAAHDGVLTIASPQGGPTAIQIGAPCVS